MPSLQPFHTFALPVNAKAVVEIHSKEQLQQLWNEYADQPLLLLGQGSNVLF